MMLLMQNDNEDDVVDADVVDDDGKDNQDTCLKMLINHDGSSWNLMMMTDEDQC